MPNYSNIINSIFGVEIGVFGITITLFTVLYSFMLSKKSELSSLTEMFRLQNKVNPLLSQKISFVNTYISKLRRVNSNLLVLCFSSFFIGIIAFLLIVIDTKNDILLYFLLVLTGLSIIYIIVLLFVIIKNYISEVKIK